MAQASLEGNSGNFIRASSLNLAQILHFFKTDNTTNEIPFRPSGGDLFVFKTNDLLKKDDWKADGHLWTNQGNRKKLPRTNPKYQKSYYCIKVDGKADKTFRKEVYFPVESPDEVCIVHYLGDASVSESAPHGNSKKTQPFFRTKPSVVHELELKTEIEKPHKLYKNLVCENTTGHDAVSKPRNVKQLHNIRAAKQEDIRLSRDAIYNTHEIAYEGNFVHYLSTYPDLCVVVGELEMIEELNSVVKMKDDNFIMSYDTTFCLGEFYVSPLVFKHTLFDENPLMAGLFLIHERKLTQTHDVFFKQLSSMVKNLRALPIVTDMESAIVRAIKDQTSLKQIGCWRHLRQDVQRWLADNLPRVERSAYINDLYDILRAQKEENCLSLINSMKERWHEEYTKYFTRNIEPKLEYFCVWSIQNHCKVDPTNGITTNISEGFNFLLKDFQNWKEVPLDCILMSLKLIQGFYLEEIRRGKAGLGTYSLKRVHLNFRTNVQEFESKKLVCHPKDIVASIRDTEIKEIENPETKEEHRSENATNSRLLRAKQLVAMDTISFSAKLGLFTVLDRNTTPTVRIHPAESCSCPIAKNCIHILAVKLGLRMQVGDCGPLQNLGVVRKNFRSVKQKPGRKRPRPGDLDKDQNYENGQINKKQIKLTDSEKTEQAYTEQMETQWTEQTEQMEKKLTEQTEQTEKQWPEQTEQNTEQTNGQYSEQTETEQTKRRESIDMLEQTVNLILSQKNDRSDITDESLAKALKELECSVVELIDDFQCRHKKPIFDQSDIADMSFEHIKASTPELKRDIRYSLDVWVPADKVRLFHNLNKTEQKILKSKTEWLNDVIIDSAMNLLQFQFPDLKGFQSCHLAHQLDFERHEHLFIQIINRSPDTGGSHWLAVSNINCLQDEVCVYDSSFDDLPHVEELTVASLVKVHSNILNVRFPKVALQTNGNDCGLYAIANATALAFGKDPLSNVWRTDIWNHSQ